MSGPFAHALLCLALALPAWAGPAPAFSLKRLDGAPFNLQDHLGKQVNVLDFWATWCGPCTRSLKKLQELHESFPEALVLAIAIDDGRTLAQVAPYVQGRGFTFTVLLDPDAAVCRMFDPEGGVPTTVVIDRRGGLAYQHTGYLAGDERALATAVAKLGK